MWSTDNQKHNTCKKINFVFVRVHIGVALRMPEEDGRGTGAVITGVGSHLMWVLETQLGPL